MTRARLMIALGLGLGACTAAPSSDVAEVEHEEAAPGPTVPSLLPPPRLPTQDGCTFLDPKPAGPPTSEGPIFDSIAYALTLTGGPTVPLEWIQPAQSPAPIDGMAFYAAKAGDRLRWCYVDPNAPTELTSCEGTMRETWLLNDGTMKGPSPEPTAMAVAVLDHAVRVYEYPEQAERCTPAPADVVASIAPAAWRDHEGRPGLEFVEEIRPLPTLARLVLVRAEPYDIIRTELWSWNPQQAR